jgi:hypothetical protein
MPIAGGAGEAPVSNAWWRGWKWRPHRQHERTPAWSLYRRGHRPPASAIRADQDGADYPRRDRRAEIVERQRADRTTAQAPARCWSKARFGPLLALAKAPALLTEGAVPESSKPPNTSPPSTRARARARGGSENQRPWPADKVERWSIDRLIQQLRNVFRSCRRRYTRKRRQKLAIASMPCTTR